MLFIFVSAFVRFRKSNDPNWQNDAFSISNMDGADDILSCIDNLYGILVCSITFFLVERDLKIQMHFDWKKKKKLEDELLAISLAILIRVRLEWEVTHIYTYTHKHEHTQTCTNADVTLMTSQNSQLNFM